jgi:hypothetical protein
MALMLTGLPMYWYFSFRRKKNTIQET